MFANIFKKLFVPASHRTANTYRRQLQQLERATAELLGMVNSELAAKARGLLALTERKDPVEGMQAISLVKEAILRMLGQAPYDVQVLAALALLDGKVAEMRTGEGKTLAAVIAAYVAALPRRGVHIATANDYLAARDASAMAPVFEFLGLSVGVTLAGMSPEQKRMAYAADVTYGASSEFVFDYLRDNLATRVEDKVQRALNFAIVDEADSVLIDSARRPMVISGPVDEDQGVYLLLNQVPDMLVRQESPQAEGDYWLDEKTQTAVISEAGHDRVEEVLTQLGAMPAGASLYDLDNAGLIYNLHAALRAHGLFIRDRNYVLHNGEIVIIDELTGRMIPGSRLEEGLHQALEAKEGVPVRPANQTHAAISTQNYFRQYPKLAGMTGTAETEAEELAQVYGLGVAVIPTRLPVTRIDNEDLIYLTADSKWAAVVEDIQARHAKSQPVLVGTTSIAANEHLSGLLTLAGVSHRVLNAKNHASEADVIASAGEPGAVTLATNMAGRGTDIILGGDLKQQLARLHADADLAPDALAARAEDLAESWAMQHEAAVAAGGLYVIGTERYESRRIDNQLRGRAGRQGDPGESRVYLSLEDPLLVLFASDAVKKLLGNLNVPEGGAIEHRWASKAVEAAQRQMEARNYAMRKEMLEYDNVVAAQRQAIYSQRNEIMAATDVEHTILAMRHAAIQQVLDDHVPPGTHEDNWDIAGAEQRLATEYELQVPLQGWLAEDQFLDHEGLTRRVMDFSDTAYLQKESIIGIENMRSFERQAMLHVLDKYWRAHLVGLERLQHGIHLRGYANKDPKQEYKREAFLLFEQMLAIVGQKVARAVYTVEMRAS